MGTVIYLDNYAPEEVDEDFPLGRFFRLGADGKSLIFSVHSPVRIELTPAQVEELGVVMIQTATMVGSDDTD